MHGRQGRLMHILLVDDNPSVRAALTSLLLDAGYAVTVICPTSSSRRFSEVVAGVRVYRFPKPWEIGGFKILHHNFTARSVAKWNRIEQWSFVRTLTVKVDLRSAGAPYRGSQRRESCIEQVIDPMDRR